MRVVKNPQMQMGEVDISKIEFDVKSRDELPQLLRGLQYIYTTPSVREAIFQLLEKNIAPHINKNNGRPGMELWKIFVIGTLRLDLNLDYDRLQDEVNHHKKIRQMLGHPDFFDEYYYSMQVLKDNVRLLTPELLDQINQIVVQTGHHLIKKKDNGLLHGRCDSFVVETDVHFPTDINLLLDAMRKVITLTAELCDRQGLSDWRQYAYSLRQVKQSMRTAQNKKRVNAKTPEQQKKNEVLMVNAHRAYIEMSQRYLNKANDTLENLEKTGTFSLQDTLLAASITVFIDHAVRQIDQIRRRVLNGDIIPHHEKVFSLFQPHTEWISKGKAGVPVELGLKVCVLEDQYRFILHHQVMEKKTDDQVAISMAEEARQRFPQLDGVSYDKGFHSPNNQEILGEQFALLTLPRKGKLSQKARALEEAPAFRQARRQHSAVESAINALEVHGLDKCPDHGIQGFKRYVALAIVARNIQRMGAILQQQAQKSMRRKMKKYSNRDSMLKRAA
jgi:IS5 family transposase